jgi:hypothetical protein
MMQVISNARELITTLANAYIHSVPNLWRTRLRLGFHLSIDREKQMINTRKPHLT